MRLLSKPLPAYSTWTFCNLAGMALYLLLASQIWPIDGEEGTPGGPGDAFYVFFVLWPFLLGILVMLFVSFFLFIRTARKKRTALLVWIIVAALWGGVVQIDRARNAYEIAAEYS